MESYMHGLAKRVLCSWLQDECKKTEFCSFGPFSWRRNRDVEPYGIWLEYPVTADGGEIFHVWDESNWSINLLGDETIQYQRPPTFDECLQMGKVPAVIFDIAIQHKGNILYGIEIVHKNGIDDNKLLKMHSIVEKNQFYPRVYTTDARYIMHQVGKPVEPELGFERVL